MKELNKLTKKELIKEIKSLKSNKVKNKIIEVDYMGNKHKIEVMPIEQKGVSYENLKIPKDWRLPNVVEAFKIYDEGLEDFKSGNNDFFVINPSNNGKIVRLFAGSWGAGLNCDWGPAYSFGWLGAIFVREVK